MTETFVKTAEGQFVKAVSRLGAGASIELLAKLVERMDAGDEMFGSLVTIDRLQRAVAKHYDLPLIEMRSARRDRVCARPRQVAMYLSKQMTPRSLPEIGRRFGGRDHTTVIHAIKAVTARRLTDPNLDADIRAIEAAL